MKISLQYQDSNKMRTYKHCELVRDDDFQTEYKGQDGDKSYAIFVDKWMSHDRNGTVYESRYSKVTEDWEEYDEFWFFPNTLIVKKED